MGGTQIAESRAAASMLAVTLPMERWRSHSPRPPPCCCRARAFSTLSGVTSSCSRRAAISLSMSPQRASGEAPGRKQPSLPGACFGKPGRIICCPCRSARAWQMTPICASHGVRQSVWSFSEDMRFSTSDRCQSALSRLSSSTIALHRVSSTTALSSSSRKRAHDRGRLTLGLGEHLRL